MASPVSGSPTSTHPPAIVVKQEPVPAVAPPPPPPERGSSYTVMSMRNKESTKRVSFDTAPVSVSNTPSSLQLDDTIREDPNVSCFSQLCT